MPVSTLLSGSWFVYGKARAFLPMFFRVSSGLSRTADGQVRSLPMGSSSTKTACMRAGSLGPTSNHSRSGRTGVTLTAVSPGLGGLGRPSFAARKLASMARISAASSTSPFASALAAASSASAPAAVLPSSSSFPVCRRRVAIPPAPCVAPSVSPCAMYCVRKSHCTSVFGFAPIRLNVLTPVLGSASFNASDLAFETSSDSSAASSGCRGGAPSAGIASRVISNGLSSCCSSASTYTGGLAASSLSRSVVA
mmetsp:Transcript_1191/g.2628  ORF Transcript_1191/g.2628 Transcript_1191/m.2628 type:complete len:252 (-) Transcript_1191:255-1010(-)